MPVDPAPKVRLLPKRKMATSNTREDGFPWPKAPEARREQSSNQRAEASKATRRDLRDSDDSEPDAARPRTQSTEAEITRDKSKKDGPAWS